MAGTSTDFDAVAFRDSIHAVMGMALPTAVIDRPTFRWTTTASYTLQDQSSHPYNWGATPTSTVTHADVQVPCAVEFQERSPEGTAIGSFDASKVILTVLDVDYAQIVGADLVLLGQRTYEIDLVAPPIGLFEVTVYQLYLHSRDA